MKININQIPPEGLTREEDVAPSELELDTDIVKFQGPIKIKADISKITNVVTADVALNALMRMSCIRCLDEFQVDYKKKVRLNYPVGAASPGGGINKKIELIIDLDEDIREEIILDYPIRPLCSLSCQGLCPQCGKNLNEGDCKCVPPQ